jgi:ferredoxin
MCASVWKTACGSARAGSPDAGIFIDNACRSGTCSSRRVKLAAGSVHMPVQDVLTDEDKAEGYILACQAELSGNVAVDA